MDGVAVAIPGVAAADIAMPLGIVGGKVQIRNQVCDQRLQVGHAVKMAVVHRENVP